MKRYIYTLVLLLVTNIISAQTQIDPINKPESGQSSYIVTAGETVTLTSAQSVTLGPGTHIQPGSTFTAKIHSNALEIINFKGGNYIYTRVFQKKMTTVSGIQEDKDVIESITYFDGLGRPMQNIAIKASPDKKDIITHIDYDAYGRQGKDWLPYTETEGLVGSYRGDKALATQEYYQLHYGDDFDGITNPENIVAYSEKHFEASALNRVLEQAAPGADWGLLETADTDPNNDNIDHTIKFKYTFNTEADYVRQFTVDLSSGDPQLFGEDCYLPNQLYKTITKDENWQPNQTYPTDHTTEEYKDKQGRVVLKRTFNLGKWHDTYYVYDDYGNLTYVLPPKMATYKLLTQQKWIGQNFNFNNLSRLIVDNKGINQLMFYLTNKGLLNFYVYAEDYGGEIELVDGLIMNLDFLNPSLPDMDLGIIKEYHNDDEVGFAYIQSGNLYIDTNGYTGVSTDLIDYTLSIDLSNYQSSFSAPAIDETPLNNLAYQYKYDSRNRLIEKRIPGKGWEYIVYNKLDQPVLTQDANLAAQNKWLFTKYDTFGRVVYTGIYNSSLDRGDLQSNHLDNETVLYESKGAKSIDGINTHYTNTAFPQSSIGSLHTINYYDDYDFNIYTIPDVLDNGAAIVNYDNTDKLKTKGLPTISKVRVLEEPNWITTVTGYDIKGRPIYIKSINDYLGTTDIIESHIDFTGKTEETIASHYRSGKTITTFDTFTYDHVGRLISQKQRIDNLTELISLNSYDELGQLESKKVGGAVAANIENSVGLQTIDYTYNIRGWLKTINDPYDSTQDGDLFRFGLNYNQPEAPITSTYSSVPLPLYNGNISHTYWKTNNEDKEIRDYTYKYDALNRFMHSYYFENNSYTGKYNTTVYGYDRNGNIESLYRSGHNPNDGSSHTMDNLVYSYDNGNKLLSVNDTYGTDSISNSMGGFIDGNPSGDDYAYDVNGNMIKDLNKGVGTTVADQITYNYLNLPIHVGINDGGSNQGNITYIYDATGVKLKKTVSTGATTEYAGNYVYENGSLKFFNTSEGYFDVASLSFGGYLEGNYVYQYKDHLGNIRLSYKDNSGSLEILEENNYYPFGLEHKGYNDTPSAFANPALKYKYNGKELQDELGLDWYDLGARNHDPALGRFMNIDPLSEDYISQSPYAFAANNPVFYVDINGEGVLDDYKLLNNGKLEKIADTNTADRIFATDDDGNVIENYSVTLEKDGQIANMKNVEVVTPDGEELQVSNISFESSEVANEVFEFVADNSDVEWSFVSAEGANYVGTSYLEGATASGNYIVGKLISKGFNNIVKKHSHPRNKTALLNAIMGFTSFDQSPSPGDINSAKNWHKKHPKVNLKHQVYDPIYQENYSYSHRGYVKPVSSLKRQPVKL